MCGIIGVLGKEPVAASIMEALRRLEYRGYDSAGIATLVNGSIERRRAEGKLHNLAFLIEKEKLSGHSGIGHTRWATHGAACKKNAHPHITNKVAVVHNGIIENFRMLRDELSADGIVFESATDTEVIAHLMTRELADTPAPATAFFKTLARLEGAFSLAVLVAGQEDLMLAARRGSPLAIGYGEGEMYLGSDSVALAPLTRKVSYLEDGDWAVLTRNGVTLYNQQGDIVERATEISDVGATLTDKGKYRHFMLKEIFEQPEVVFRTLSEYLDPTTETLSFPDMPVDFADIPKVTIIACGTAFYAACVAKNWFEQIARLPVEVDIASEFRYREAPLPPGGLALFISQSGETADTLAALRYCREQKQKIVSIVNMRESSIARESDVVLPTFAGPEIGVASTKAFTCQLAVLILLAIRAASERRCSGRDEEALLIHHALEIPRLLSEVLSHDQAIKNLAADLARAQDILYIGRGTMFPLAMEGALKLKEISYIHAEGYAAGELKHGPIALVDKNVPVIVVAPSSGLYDKTLSNLQEVRAREGRIVLISDAEGLERASDDLDYAIEVPLCDKNIAPLVYAVPVQLLAYHIAVYKGTDVDQPRNLAKSVTVE